MNIARDVLTNRRSHDICNKGECFYPTVIQLAEQNIKLEAALREVREEIIYIGRPRTTWHYVTQKIDAALAREVDA